jgi:competence protein ComEA
MLPEFFREYFSFSRGERNGTIVMAVIMLIVFAFPHFHSFFAKPRISRPDAHFLAEVSAFYGLGENSPDTGTFLASQRQNPHQARREIIADTTGRGSKSESSSTRSNERTGSRADTGSSGGATGTPVKTDLNSADTLELMQVRGIGPTFSRRILRYRDILGGYAQLTQLMEVYGIDEQHYNNICDFLCADTSLIIKLHPVTDNFGTLLRHPYLDYEQVARILRLRNTGKLNSPEDLLQSPAFSETDLARLRPYLFFE